MTNSEALRHLLLNLRNVSETPREKGTSFENLVTVFLSDDATYSKQFSEVLTYQDWAKSQNTKKGDSGIDLVAKNKNDNFYTAIQCKFYSENATIDKGGIDSFIANSDRDDFNRRVLVDTTKKGLSSNLETQIETISKNFTRISINELENSSIDWSRYLDNDSTVEQIEKKQIRQHQEDALNAVKKGLKTADRGKLIMACGSGKTFTSLKIAEDLVGKNKSMLFLVPSLALMSQTITEWTNEATTDLNIYAVCSDAQVGKRKVSNDDELAEISVHDLAYPATTDAKKLADKYKIEKDKMTVVFATYQSIEVISQAQQKYKLPDFNLVVCDEAHRTSGATLKDGKTSNFNKIHSQDFVKANKRIYMTATPRVYIEKVKAKAKDKEALLYSMDDETLYGKELYVLNFGDAVDKGLLADYKVIVLALDEGQIAESIQKNFTDIEGLDLKDAVRMVGCYKALSKIGISDTEDTKTMQRAVAFCENIKKSELFQKVFMEVVNEYLSHQKDTSKKLNCEVRHVDGTMNTAIRNDKLNFLKQEMNDDECHILTNARCLSEGVDVPTLDAVMFIHPRKSKTDIVQSVGRVMRIAPNKKLGYVILPVVIPVGVEPSEALKNGKNYEIIWDVLNALRSHDERMDSDINKIQFGELPSKMEVISEIDTLPSTDNPTALNSGKGGSSNDGFGMSATQSEIDYEYDSVQQAILSKIVDKCGTRNYWGQWAVNIAETAQTIIVRIKAIIKDKNSEEYKAVNQFLNELQKNINNSITEDEVVEMLAQHIITQPVFDTLFGGDNFSSNNPVSKAIQKVIDVLNKHNLDNESQDLKAFYASVNKKVDSIEKQESKQAIIIELYDKFFKTAFPKMAERLGIVYTPVECVDFIIHSVNDVLKKEFKQSLGDKNTHIIDPFTGTGTFITRIIQSGLISKEQLKHKYQNELHANEIVLLAYYIATINIEAVYNGVMADENNTKNTAKYEPFTGVCLTDTFQLYEDTSDLITPLLPVNSERLNKQKNLDIKVIIGNPPYNDGQQNENDNNQSVSYTKLDKNIELTYVKHSTASLRNSLYDSYIRAIRWASDRIGDTGVIGFITNSGWIEKGVSDGMRKTLQSEFNDIYIFNLKGGVRGKSKDIAKKEGKSVFNIMTGVAISILVKNPKAKTSGNIYFHDIGDYLSREKKLKIIKDFGSIDEITKQDKWQKIQPDKYNDWLNQRDDSFYNHIAMGDKKDKTSIDIFENYSQGVLSSRDAWIYNLSKQKLEINVKNTIDFYNQELERYQQSLKQNKDITINKFINTDKTKIAWSGALKKDLKNNKKSLFKKTNIVQSLYRPFTKQYCYFNRQWNERVYQMPKIFPEIGITNLVIGLNGRGSRKGFNCLISNVITDNQLLENGQCFPLKLYAPILGEQSDEKIGMFGDSDNIVEADSGQKYKVKDGITDEGLKHFTDYYQDTKISKEDLFYYIYGLLHSPDYKKRFANNLVKDLPRIPQVKDIADFWTFSKSGRKLADLHINYENKEPYAVSYKDGNMTIEMMVDKDFYVEKMRFANKEDKSTIIYNHNITIHDIPLEAYDYVVNGKSAIEWVMDRQRIATHPDSQIINNPNDWANEEMNNPKYPLELLLKVITISVETVGIIKKLPTLHF